MKKMNVCKPIIAICGAKRSGKDIAADYIAQQYNYEKIKLAQPLKTMVQQLFGFTNNQIGDTDDKDVIDKKWGITPRQALQFFGTEVMQYKIQELLPGIGRRFWVNMLCAKLETDKRYVISDLRFGHEYEELKKRGAYVIKIMRTQCDVLGTSHPSEEEYKTLNCDAVIYNDSTIDDFLIKLDNTLSRK